MGYDFRLAKNNEIDTIFSLYKKEFNAAFGCFALMPFYDIVSFTAATAITNYRNSSVSFYNTALLLISDFFPAPLAKL